MIYAAGTSFQLAAHFLPSLMSLLFKHIDANNVYQNYSIELCCVMFMSVCLKITVLNLYE